MLLKPLTLDYLIRILENVASKDATRYHLGCVELKPLEKDHVQISATDGHMLSQVVVEDEVLFAIGVGYLHRDELGYLKFQKKANPHGIPAEASPGSLKIGGREVLVPAGSISYPNLEPLRPKWEGEFEIAFNPELLFRLYKSMAERKDGAVHLVIKSSSDPIKVFSFGQEGLLMPMRVNESRIPKKEAKP